MPADSFGLFVSRTTQERNQESLECFHIQDCYLLGSHFPERFVNTKIGNSPQLNDSSALLPHECKHAWFGLLPFRSPLLGESQELLSIWGKAIRFKNRNEIASLAYRLILKANAIKTLAILRSREDRIESNSILLSIPPGTEMFHFPGYAPSYKGTWQARWVSPFRDLRIEG